jgi:hypothetical protein
VYVFFCIYLLGLRCTLHLQAKRGALSVPMGKAEQIRGINEDIS